MNNNSFGKWLKGWRKKRRLSTRQLSTLLDVSQTYIWKIENEKVGPSLKFTNKFASVFEEPEVYIAAGRLIPEEELIKIKNNPNKNNPNIIDNLLKIHEDERGSFGSNNLKTVDDPELSKFIIDTYLKLKKTSFEYRDLEFLKKMIDSYFSAKELK
ncbi:MAG: Helix-turn-helix domain protein [Pelotomaculum sp. PtaB.Bin013]|uniref:Helix-turn-helix domain-containing protein n=1 Tax=Pelotomaculum isophthalicicum JI TaxID=947010 RepID=A0A9X4H046_9FIRM|nr:helix-turn-helix transcriptional regulator [Pelotomaculum isophthalicicum]MDF9409500.1 helix-turn-helix domain-containing protein [Pelotomaculum isophthalicicum JI]OPX92202.1 MAG: Helix-turn-helix domain protein [Pelotomaculum sp. PtaB.Bin013]